MTEVISEIKVRDMGDGDWYWVSRRVFEDFASKIGVVGFALYNAYASYARDKGVAFPSQETLVKKLGLSVKTIMKYNRVLKANGLIKIEGEVVRKAKEIGLNVSKISENALKEVIEKILSSNLGKAAGPAGFEEPRGMKGSQKKQLYPTYFPFQIIPDK